MMKTKRFSYKKVCNDRQAYSGDRFLSAFKEALEVFQQRRRKRDDSEFYFEKNHNLTIADLEEIAEYMDCIWSNNEIYYMEEE